jgi:hypothetical protein
MAGQTGKSKRGLNASKSRSSGMKGPKASSGNRAKRTATKSPPPPQIAGEKSVRPTRKSLDVKPVKATRASRKPMDPRAIDRRKQVFDDAKR